MNGLSIHLGSQLPILESWFKITRDSSRSSSRLHQFQNHFIYEPYPRCHYFLLIDCILPAANTSCSSIIFCTHPRNEISSAVVFGTIVSELSSTNVPQPQVLDIVKTCVVFWGNTIGKCNFLSRRKRTGGKTKRRIVMPRE